MAGTSGLDFKTLRGELAYWLSNVGQPFKGGKPGSGENGYDFTMPEGTPVYAILPGKVVGVGVYKGGGVVAVQNDPNNIIYYQHLILNQANVGDTIGAGEQIGLSGGLHKPLGLGWGAQPGGPGIEPVQCCSNFAHIEVGINAPFGGFWNPNNVGGGVSTDPIGLFTRLLKQLQQVDIPTGGKGVADFGAPGGGAGGGGGIGFPSAADIGAAVQGAISSALSGIFSNFPATIRHWLSQPLRIAKLVLGTWLVGTAVVLTALNMESKTAGPVAETVGLATGTPELIAAGNVARNISNRKKRQPIATVTVPGRQPGPRGNQAGAPGAPGTPPGVVPGSPGSPGGPPPVRGGPPPPTPKNPVVNFGKQRAPATSKLTQPLQPASPTAALTPLPVPLQQPIQPPFVGPFGRATRPLPVPVTPTPTQPPLPVKPARTPTPPEPREVPVLTPAPTPPVKKATEKVPRLWYEKGEEFPGVGILTKRRQETQKEANARAKLNREIMERREHPKYEYGEPYSLLDVREYRHGSALPGSVGMTVPKRPYVAPTQGMPVQPSEPPPDIYVQRGWGMKPLEKPTRKGFVYNPPPEPYTPRMGKPPKTPPTAEEVLARRSQMAQLRHDMALQQLGLTEEDIANYRRTQATVKREKEFQASNEASRLLSPSDAIRAFQGLPPLTEEEKAARLAPGAGKATLEEEEKLLRELQTLLAEEESRGPQSPRVERIQQDITKVLARIAKLQNP